MSTEGFKRGAMVRRRQRTFSPPTKKTLNSVEREELHSDHECGLHVTTSDTRCNLCTLDKE